MKNNYPPNFIDSCIKSFFNSLYTPKVIVQNVPKRNFFVKLLFLEELRFKFERSFKKNTSYAATTPHSLQTLRRALGNQRFLFRVRLLAMCRGELSAVIARLTSKCL